MQERSFYFTAEASFTALMKDITMTFRLMHFYFSVSCKNKYDIRSVVFPQTNWKKTAIYAVRFMVRDVTCTEIHGGMTVHRCDNRLDQSKFYECVEKLYGRQTSVCSWRIFVAVRYFNC